MRSRLLSAGFSVATAVLLANPVKAQVFGGNCLINSTQSQDPNGDVYIRFPANDINLGYLCSVDGKNFSFLAPPLSVGPGDVVSIGTNPALNYSFLDYFAGSQQPSGSQADGAAGPDDGEVLVPAVFRQLEFNFQITDNSGALDQIGAFVDDPGVNGLAVSPPTQLSKSYLSVGGGGSGTVFSVSGAQSPDYDLILGDETFVTVTDNFFFGNTVAKARNIFVQRSDGSLSDVPTPLPIFGAVAAFSYAKKFRKRIKASSPE